MKKPLTLMISFLIAGLIVGTATVAPAQMSDDSFLSAQTGSLAVASAAIKGSLSPTPSSTTVAAAAEATPAQPASSTDSARKPAVSKTPARPAALPKPMASRGGSSPASSPAPTNKSKSTAVIATAKQYLGVKYVWGGTTPAGFDCSGFTQYVFAQHGISLPRVSRDQYGSGKPVSFESLQAGDLVFFALNGNGIDHMGIYIGAGQFINASTSKGVAIYTFGSYWKSHYVGARRVL